MPETSVPDMESSVGPGDFCEKIGQKGAGERVYGIVHSTRFVCTLTVARMCSSLSGFLQRSAADVWIS